MYAPILLREGTTIPDPLRWLALARERFEYLKRGAAGEFTANARVVTHEMEAVAVVQAKERMRLLAAEIRLVRSVLAERDCRGLVMLRPADFAAVAVFGASGPGK